MKKLSFLLVLVTSIAYAVCPPLPTVFITANPPSVDSGGISSLQWSSTDADSCTASGDWTGIKDVGGGQNVGPLSANSSFTLTCENIAGPKSATVNVAINTPPPPPPPPGSKFGLEWPGDADVTGVRRMLYWANPPPAFPLTIIVDVYPRKKTNHDAYFTTYFWGNNGPFGGCNYLYHGAHPYPTPPPSGAGHWEITLDCADIVASKEVQWGRWHTQAMIAYTNQSGSHTFLDFYYDLPDTTKVVHNDGYKRSQPPHPAIVMGQAPSNGIGNESWGGYAGWEELNGIIRGIQIYTAKLTLAEIQQEISQPLSTATGAASIWYLNLNPRPSDVTDKKGVGTPHNPQWEGTTALEWSDAV